MENTRSNKYVITLMVLVPQSMPRCTDNHLMASANSIIWLCLTILAASYLTTRTQPLYHLQDSNTKFCCYSVTMENKKKIAINYIVNYNAVSAKRHQECQPEVSYLSACCRFLCSILLCFHSFFCCNQMVDIIQNVIGNITTMQCTWTACNNQATGHETNTKVF